MTVFNLSLSNLSNLHVIYMVISAFIIAWLILALGSVRLMLLIISILALIVLIASLFGHGHNTLSGLHKIYMFVSSFILIWLFLVIVFDNKSLISDTLFGSYNHVLFLGVLFMLYLIYMINKK